MQALQPESRSYQCAVRRDEWQKLRREVFSAFGLQKAAYRRANGGTTAPELKEAPFATLKPGASRRSQRDTEPVIRQLLVKGTFLEVKSLFVKSKRRAKTMRW